MKKNLQIATAFTRQFKHLARLLGVAINRCPDDLWASPQTPGSPSPTFSPELWQAVLTCAADVPDAQIKTNGYWDWAGHPCPARYPLASRVYALSISPACCTVWQCSGEAQGAKQWGFS